MTEFFYTKAGYRRRPRHPDRRSTKTLLVALSMMNLQLRPIKARAKAAWYADDNQRWMIYIYQHETRVFTAKVADLSLPANQHAINPSDNTFQLTRVRSTLRLTLLEILAIIEGKEGK